MPVSVTMPRLGESVTEGTVTRWLKQEGDHVEADEPLLEVSTDKVDTEIPSPAAGVLQRIVVAEDETAEVGSELAVIAGEGDDSGDAGSGASAQEEPEAEAEPEPEAQAEPEPEPEQETQTVKAEAAPPKQSGGGGSGTPITMPALGESVTEGTVTRWLKSVGDTIEADEPLLEVSTDKVDTEIPSPVAGTLLEIKVQEDETVEVGAELALIGSGDAAGGGDEPESTPSEEAKQAEPAKEEPKAEPKAEKKDDSEPAPQPGASYGTPSAEAETQQAPKVEPSGQQPAPAKAEGNGGQAASESAGYVTPLVRKLASEHNVDLSALRGTGVGGRIRKQDVLEAAEKAKAAAAKPAAAPAPAAKAAAPAKPSAEASALRGKTEKMTRLRALIAKRMVESLQVSAQLTSVVEIDVTKIAQLRNRAKNDFLATNGVKLSFLPFFALATIEAMKSHPVVNATINSDEGTVTYHDVEHLGIAVDTEKGLIVPVIRNAGDLNLVGIAKRIADLADRTRTMKLQPDEASGGTLTLTNTGSRGALFDTPIINQPQVAILGTGAVVKRAVVVSDPNLGEVIVPRSMVYFALSYDHRLVDGAEAARFLVTIKERLEAGNFEAELGLA
jgi:2-oxoglutarate dehydrogenase E2 component (dihydrolipoamide succinyltransferase)